MSQAEDRCHRIGQANSVLVQHLVLEGSLDAEIANRLVEKQAVIDQALDRRTEIGAVDAAWNSFITIGDATTRQVSRAAIAEEAGNIGPVEIVEIQEQLRILAGLCDGAVRRDDIGFNRYDAPVGHTLAAEANLTPRQAALGRRLLRKYHRQLEGGK